VSDIGNYQVKGGSMRYALLNYLDEDEWQRLGDHAKAAFVRQFATFHTSLEERGHFIDAARLMPAEIGTSVHIHDGERQLTRAPAVKAPEQLGGYMLIEAADLDEALALAAESPLARFGTVEVRRVMQTPARTAIEATTA
jgi:hypothetical protein